MKRIFLTLTMVLALCATSAAAQGLGDADGLESSYGRQYSDSSSSTSAASASAPSDTASSPKPMEGEAAYKSVTTVGMSFESEEDAENFLGEMRLEIEAATEQSDEAADAEIQELAIDNNGFLAVMNVPNTGVNTVVLFVDGDTVFLVDVTHPDRETANNIANDVTGFIVDAESESDDVTFKEDGTSTGGVFDRMPQSGDEVVDGLEVSQDLNLMAP